MKEKYVILLHLAVWLLLILSDTLTGYTTAAGTSSTGNLVTIKYLLIALGFNLISASTFYGSYLLVGPPLFVKKQFFRAGLLALLVLSGMVTLRYAIEYGFFLPVLNYDNYRGNRWTIGHYINNAVFFYLPRYFTYGLIYFAIEYWQQDSKRSEELRREKLTAELAFLRSQINPHFIFNTINDIYALTYQKSDQAPAALLKLSELLRYMLREGQQDQVPLSEEITYLQNVVELQRIGAKGEAFVEFSVIGTIQDQKIASLLLIAFVENAFKHGIWNDPEYPLFIQLKTETASVLMLVQNKISPYQKDRTGGIGLTNVRRRLELIYPDGKHQLEIS
ncbi:MAG: histidine kinase [Sphingobacteriaceae bacterium]|nr:MAG: histidine kinase [Sphingobacteriaceae bacterium]